MGALSRLVVASVVGTVATATLVAPASAATFPYKTPSSLKSTAQTATTLTFDWKDVSGAPQYRIQLSKSSKMTDATYHRFWESQGRISGLDPKTKYYAKVRVISGAPSGEEAENLSEYTSKAVSASTKSVSAPGSFAVTAPAAGTVTATWTASEGAVAYEVQASTSSKLSSPTTQRVTGSPATFDGLRADTKYYLRARVVSASGSGVSGYTSTKSITTPKVPTTPPTTPTPTTSTPTAPPTGSADLRVGSFNLSGANNDDDASGEHRVWAERRPVVVSQIVGEGSDVVGLQEAYEGTAQYTDLRNALHAAGKPFEVTDTERSASRATRIIYNTDTVSMQSKGSFKYVNQVSGKTDRYFVWATFTQRSTGKRFFFVSTHLSPNDSAVKKKEWQELIPKVKELNTDNLPVIVTGDFNTSKFKAEAKDMLPAMKAAGFGDVMNQEFEVNPPRNPRAEKVVNGWINSFNDYRRDIGDYAYDDRKDKVGNGIDWVFATNSLRVKEWKVVIDFNPSTLKINGVIPSDHNMISAVLVL